MNETLTEKIHRVNYRCPSCSSSIAVATPLIGDIVDCPQCSVPFKAKAPEADPEFNASAEADFSIDKPTDDESVIFETHPAMFRRHPIQFVLLTIVLIAAALFCVSMAVNQAWILAGCSLIVMIVIGGYFGYWYLDVIATHLIITNKRTTLRHGIIAKKTSEVQHDDIRNLQVDQNALQRILGIGTIAISSSGQDDVEVSAKAIPNPNEVADLVRRMQ